MARGSWLARRPQHHHAHRALLAQRRELQTGGIAGVGDEFVRAEDAVGDAAGAAVLDDGDDVIPGPRKLVGADVVERQEIAGPDVAAEMERRCRGWARAGGRAG